MLSNPQFMVSCDSNVLQPGKGQWHQWHGIGACNILCCWCRSSGKTWNVTKNAKIKKAEMVVTHLRRKVASLFVSSISSLGSPSKNSSSETRGRWVCWRMIVSILLSFPFTFRISTFGCIPWVFYSSTSILATSTVKELAAKQQHGYRCIDWKLGDTFSWLQGVR